MSVPAKSNAPDPFYGLAFEMDEIAKAAMMVGATVQLLRAAHINRELSQVEQAATAIAIKAGQLHTIASGHADVAKRLRQQEISNG